MKFKIKQTNYTLIIFLIIILTSFTFTARPLNTDDFPTVARESFEFSSCYDFVDTGQKNLGLTLKYGLTDMFDIGLVLPCPIDSLMTPGATDILLKHQLGLPDKFLGNTTLSLTYSNANQEYLLNFIKSWYLGTYNLHLNIGYKNQLQNSTQFIVTSVAGEYTINDYFDVVAEIINFSGIWKSLAGIRYKTAKNLAFDLSYITDHTDSAVKPIFTAGLTWTI